MNHNNPIENRKRAIAALISTPARKSCEVEPHEFPLTIVKHNPTSADSTTSAGCFERIERQYHGHEMPLEVITSSHPTRSLDALIKSRS